jgi:uncharacterized protein (DUF1778 family)
LAAALDGTDLTAIVLGAAMDKARKVWSQYASIALTPEAQAKRVDLLQQAPAPPGAMRTLMKTPELPELPELPGVTQGPQSINPFGSRGGFAARQAYSPIWLCK